MSNSLQRYKNFDLTFQIAFVSTIVSLIATLLISILASLLPNHIFSAGGLSILLAYGDGTLNQGLITGLIITATFFIVFLAPALIKKNNSIKWSRRAIYIYAGLLFIGLVIYAILIPYLHGAVPAFQTNYYITIFTLSSIGSFLICSQPVIAERADRKKNKTAKLEQ